MSRGGSLALALVGGTLCLFGIVGMMFGLPILFFGLILYAKRRLRL